MEKLRDNRFLTFGILDDVEILLNIVDKTMWVAFTINNGETYLYKFLDGLIYNFKASYPCDYKQFACIYYKNHKGVDTYLLLRKDRTLTTKNDLRSTFRDMKVFFLLPNNHMKYITTAHVNTFYKILELAMKNEIDIPTLWKSEDSKEII